jgi:uncharacterized coiled-coil protein SlyX
MAASIAQSNIELMARIQALEESDTATKMRIETLSTTLASHAELIKRMQSETTRTATKPRAATAASAASTTPRVRAPPAPKSPRGMFANDWVISEDMHNEYNDIIELLTAKPPMDQYKAFAVKYANAMKMPNGTPEEKKKRGVAISYVIYDSVMINTLDERIAIIKKKFDDCIEAKRTATPKRGARATSTTRPIIAAEELIDDGDAPSDDSIIASASTSAPTAKPTARKPRATMATKPRARKAADADKSANE